MAHKNKKNWSPYTARLKSKNVGQTPTKKGQHKKPEQIYSFEEADERLYDYLRHHGLGSLPHDQRHKLTQFYLILMQNQVHQNFTRLTKLRDIAIKHFVDSMIVPSFCNLKFPLLDVGTGPGFPGIPLKIMYPTERILLGEGVQKRVDFLKLVREKLELKNLDIIGRNINPEFALPVFGIITRAVEDMSNTLTNVQTCLQVGGQVYFMKGPGCDPEIEYAVKKWGEFYKLVQNTKYELPNSPHERRLVVFEKIKLTPEFEFNHGWDDDNQDDEF